MLIPTILSQYSMTYDINLTTIPIINTLVSFLGITTTTIPPLIIGLLFIISNYQMWYGTVIYFLSFFFNNRHLGKSTVEVALFVGVSNGIWFLFPLLGMWIGYYIILNDNMKIVR